MLFLPALIWEIASGAGTPEMSFSRRLQSVGRWCACFTLFGALAFAPLVLAGVAQDFVGSLRVTAFGGHHHKATLGDALHVFATQFESWKADIPLLVALVVAASPRNQLSRIGRTWRWRRLGCSCTDRSAQFITDTCALPLILVSSITWAIAVSWLLSIQRIARPISVLAVVLLVYEFMPSPPWMCNVVQSIRARTIVQR